MLTPRLSGKTRRLSGRNKWTSCQGLINGHHISYQIRRHPKAFLLILLFTLIAMTYILIYLPNSKSSISLHSISNVQNPLFLIDNLQQQQRKQITESNENDLSYSQMTDLVIVAGHAVYSHYSYKECTDPNHWRLMEHQKRENHLSAFLEHIAVGIDLVAKNPNALLMFSGGSTRSEVGPFSEGSTYWKVAENCDYRPFDRFKNIQNRAFTEDYAMDSFQNILFSVCRFYEITGRYPLSITAISWSYKKTRFEKLHRKALLYPQGQFKFLGVDGQVNITENAWKFEKMAIELFKEDLFGCHSKLKETRIGRNPYFRSLPYPHQCPSLSAFFHVCADSSHFTRLSLRAPWN